MKRELMHLQRLTEETLVHLDLLLSGSDLTLTRDWYIGRRKALGAWLSGDLDEFVVPLTFGHGTVVFHKTAGDVELKLSKHITQAGRDRMAQMAADIETALATLRLYSTRRGELLL